VLFGGSQAANPNGGTLADTWQYGIEGPPGVCIPTLSEWGMMAMAALMLSAGAAVLRRRAAA
jgi:hypothetical protein